MTNQAYETNFRVSLMAKDLSYAYAEAQHSGIDLSTAEAAIKRFEEGDRAGFGSRDIASVVEVLRASRT
jgi:3-hydroxyisobutyrate dehydrogenase-like beta-hydroxyacid dehydrogenase